MTTGARFAKWGLGRFIAGLFLTFGIHRALLRGRALAAATTQLEARLS